MMKPENKISNSVWLELRGYRVVALKPEFDGHAAELERAIHEGISASPDMARADFYDVALDEGSAYIHIYRSRHVAYLVSHSRPQIPAIGQINWRNLQNSQFVAQP